MGFKRDAEEVSFPTWGNKQLNSCSHEIEAQMCPKKHYFFSYSSMRSAVNLFTSD